MIVNIIGGLGNQLFQYAFAYSVSKKIGAELKLDITAFSSYDLRDYTLDVFQLNNDQIATPDEIVKVKYRPTGFLSGITHRLLKRPQAYASTYYKETNLRFDARVFQQTSDTYFDGYWQSEKYFLDYRDDLISQFNPKSSLSSKSRYFHKLILTKLAVSIHVRRGDYVSDAKTNHMHGTCSLDYYQRAVSFYEAKLDSPCFFVFSDDLDWAKKHFNFSKNIYYVELDSNTPDYEEMILMSHCEHHIIANSSFSWWGAWLNNKPNKLVVAPEKWFNDSAIDTADLIPTSWIRL